MKTDIQDLPEVQSTMTGKGIRMEIATEAMQHVMHVLTNLYKDPELAIIREYSTNAYDAHIEAGIDRPIEVSLPTHLSPYLKIRDFGYGLDPDDIATIYSQYGASTKRDTDEQVGSLGFGCKSALAYTNQFTLVSIKSGKRCTVMVSLNDEGVGEMNIVAQDIPTDAPEGTEVTIPTKAGGPYSMARKAAEFFAHWTPGTVLVDGQGPALFTPEQLLKITDNITLCKTDQYYAHKLIMGNVAYPLEIEDLDLASNWALIVHVPIGAVSIAPSRELLRYTDKTKAVVEQVKTTFEAEVTNAVSRELDNAVDVTEAICIMNDWKKVVPKGFVASYKGRDIPDALEAPEDQPFILSDGQKRDYVRIGKSSHNTTITINLFPGILWVHNFDRGFTPMCKKKLWAYCDQRGIEYPGHFVMTAKRIRSPWIEKSRRIDWKVVEQIKLPKKNRQGTVSDRIPLSYDIYTPAKGFQRGVPDTEIDTSHPIYYLAGGGSCFDRLKNFEDDFTLVTFYANRQNKFLRLFPQAQNAYAVLESYKKLWWDNLTEMEKVDLQMNQRDRKNLRFFMARRIDDPEFRKLVNIAHRSDPKLHAMMSQVGFHGIGMRQYPWRDTIAERYPLLDGYGPYRQHTEHYYLYINAVYAANQE